MENNEVKRIQVQIPLTARTVEFNDLGGGITDEFVNLYRKFYTFGALTFDENFISQSVKLFTDFNKDNMVALSDKYFENFTVITQQVVEKGMYRKAFELWNEIIQFAKGWEELNKKSLHKGVPYYFASVSAILSMDFDAALISMRLALAEDKLNSQNYKRTPAYYFLTLNDEEPDQYFKYFVNEMINFLRDRLDGQGGQQGRYKEHYQKSRRGILTYEDLRKKFLDNDNISDEIKYFFVYSTIKFWRLRRLHKSRLKDDIIAPVIFSQVLGSILITIELLLKQKYPGLTSLGNLIEKMASDKNWGLSCIGNTLVERDRDFNVWMDKYLDENTLLGDFIFVYGLRNFTFHTIESQQKLWKDFTKVLQSVWNCLFKTIEILPY